MLTDDSKILVTSLEELKQRILDRYDIEDILLLLGIECEDILDVFEEKLLDNLDDLCITTDTDYYNET